MGEIIFLNGKYVPREEAKVSIFDFGYLYGDGVFETLRSYGGFIFKFEKHLTRLLLSAHRLNFPIKYNLNTFKFYCYKTLKKNNLKDASIRITITRGIGKGRFDPTSCKKPTISILANEFTGYQKNLYTKGLKVTFLKNVNYLSGLKRPQIKSCNYQANVLAKIEVTRQNLLEGLFLNQKGHIVEGITSNIFILKNKTLFTPSLDSGCLNGITRNTVLGLAKKKLDLHIREADISPQQLSSAQECFLTNSLMELIPVVQVGKKLIGNGKPGKITQQLLKEYRILVRNDSKEFSGKRKQPKFLKHHFK